MNSEFVAVIAERERKLDVRRFRAGDDRDLGVRIERHAVDVAVARGDRPLSRGSPRIAA